MSAKNLSYSQVNNSRKYNKFNKLAVTGLVFIADGCRNRLEPIKVERLYKAIHDVECYLFKNIIFFISHDKYVVLFI